MPSILRIVFILGATGLYFALAIAGGGGGAAFFAHPARVALAIVTAALALAACFVGGNLSPGLREDRGNRWVIAALGVLGLLMSFLPALTERLGVLVIDGDAARWNGVALYAIGGALRLWPVAVLGHRFSGLVAIQPGHALVTDGVYSHIRNPSYLGFLVNAVGWALAFRSGVGLLLAALCLLPLHVRMDAEERLLGDEFGARYAAYRARTWRLVPFVY